MDKDATRDGAEDATPEVAPQTAEDVRGFKVCAKKCDECLFTPQRIVPPERMAEILHHCLTQNSHFICHKHSEQRRTPGGKRTTAKGRDVCCRGFYDTYPYATVGMRLAHVYNLVVFIGENGNVVEDQATPTTPTPERTEP